MRYCSYFCEENVWHLCGDESVKDGERIVPLDDRRVVFVSNDRRALPMDHQKAGGGTVVVWDYHVVLFALTRTGWHCWDLDHDKGCPRELFDWMKDSFFVDSALEAYRHLTGLDVDGPRFRIVDADEFCEEFASDRSHMLDAKGRPTRPFPEWPVIGGGSHNVMRYVDTRSAWHGDVLSYDDVRLLYCRK